MNFTELWALLRQHGSSAKRETECAALWVTYPPDVQQRIYNAIRTKLEQGKFVHFDPLRAIEENARSPVWYGWCRKSVAAFEADRWPIGRHILFPVWRSIRVPGVAAINR